MDQVLGSVSGKQQMKGSNHVDFLFIAANSRSLLVNRRPVIEALQRLGLVVGALIPDEEFLAEVEVLGVKTWRYSLDRHSMGIGGEIRRFLEIYRLIRLIAPKAVMGYAVKPIILGVPAARLAGVKETYCLATGLGYLFGHQGIKARVLRFIITYLYALSGGVSKAFFLQNPDDRDELQRNWAYRRVVNSIVVNGSGVDIAEYPCSEVPLEPVSFLFMGRFLREKGIYDFVDAAREVRQRYPGARFVALGSRDSSLVNSITEEELESWENEGNVCFPGRVRDVSSYLKSATVVVLPSYYREGVPRALLEAMSTGRAILTCDTPGCRETVIDGDNGWLVPAMSPSVLAERMCRFLADSSIAVRMGQSERARVISRFTTEIVSAQMLSEMSIASQVGGAESP